MLFSRLPIHPFITGLAAFIVALSLIIIIPWELSPPKALLPSLSLSRTTVTLHDQPRWLLAIFLPPSHVSRRAVIRSTWATRYANPSYEYRFVLGNYSSSPWAPVVTAENETYGDIWMLEDYAPDIKETADRIKTMEFYKYVAQQQDRRYDFVSKVDDDNWFNIPPFYNAFIAPRFPGGPKYNPNALTMIGRPMSWIEPYVYSSGRMYTVNWPLLEFFVEKYTSNPINDVYEDVLAGLYLYENRTEHEFVPVELEQAWDIGLECLVDNETIMIHGIKHDERLLEISTMFDGEGRWNGKRISGLTNYNRTMREVVDRIGEVTEDEMESLKREWESWRSDGNNGKDGAVADVGNGVRGGANAGNPKDTLDWKLIREKITIEDREELGRMYPLNLPGNNISTGVHG